MNTEAEPTANAAPELLKIWGTLIAGTNALMLPYAALMLFVGVRGGLRTGSATTLLAGVLPVAVAIVCVRLGIGLYRGQRQAVIGVGLLGVLVLPCLLYVAVTKQPLMGLIVLGQASALIVPAVWVGAKNYTRLPN